TPLLYIDQDTFPAEVYRFDDSLPADSKWVFFTTSTPSWGDIIGDLDDQDDLEDALDAKQATLVSGTNIKTVNSTSLLGSGDIDTDPAWGEITGTLSAQTDLQSELDDKQDVLVSGTNIKTLNSTSLLGSGNIDT